MNAKVLPVLTGAVCLPFILNRRKKTEFRVVFYWPETLTCYFTLNFERKQTALAMMVFQDGTDYDDPFISELT